MNQAVRVRPLHEILKDEDMTKFLSKYQMEKQATDIAIYRERMKLESDPNAMKGAIDEYLMDKYHKHSRSAIWRAVERVKSGRYGQV